MNAKEVERLVYISDNVGTVQLLVKVINLEYELSEVNYRLGGLQ